MERFTDKNMTESQITEIVELMNGEHAEALQLWAKRNENSGVATGMVGGVMLSVLAYISGKIAVSAAKATWGVGKAFVEAFNEYRPG